MAIMNVNPGLVTTLFKSKCLLVLAYTLILVFYASSFSAAFGGWGSDRLMSEMPKV